MRTPATLLTSFTVKRWLLTHWGRQEGGVRGSGRSGTATLNPSSPFENSQNYVFASHVVFQQSRSCSNTVPCDSANAFPTVLHREETAGWGEREGTFASGPAPAVSGRLPLGTPRLVPLGVWPDGINPRLDSWPDWTPEGCL